MTVRNPILPGFHADPSICRAGDEYFLVTTTLDYFPGVPVYRSRDLVSWELTGHALTRRSQLDLLAAPSSPGVFAPTIRYHGGMFYLVTTIVGGGGNILLTARDPAGPWSEPRVIDDGLFDPSLFFDDDGRVYYTRRGSPGIVQAEIDVDTGRLTTPLRTVVERFICDDIEGPHLSRIGGWYYLLAAEGGSRYGHAVVIGRSDTPWGPFESCPHNPILTHRDKGHGLIRDVGHADLVQWAGGSWWAVCLGTRHLHYNSFSILGRETFLIPVHWTADGWPVLGTAGRVPERFTTDVLPASSPRPDSWREEFDGPGLHPAWVYLRNPHEGDYSLSERPGWLRLQGTPDTLNDRASPTFLAQRQEHFLMEFTCRLDFSPALPTEEAGITVRMNEAHHYDLAVTVREQRPCVILRKTVGDLVLETPGTPIADGPVSLTVTCDGTSYHFQAAPSRPGSIDVGAGLARLLSPEVAHEGGAWSGMMLGLYTTGNGQRCRRPAFYDWCSYRGEWSEGAGFRNP